MATTLGLQILARYYAGTATVAHLDQALLREWITQDEYDRAIAGLPPENQPPMPTRLATTAQETPPAE